MGDFVRQFNLSLLERSIPNLPFCTSVLIVSTPRHCQLISMPSHGITWLSYHCMHFTGLFLSLISNDNFSLAVPSSFIQEETFRSTFFGRRLPYG